MLNRTGIDLQPYVDTIHLAAVETLRSSPDLQVIESGQHALRTVIEHAGVSSHCLAIVEIARLTQEAFEAATDGSSAPSTHVGHQIAAMVADLGRAIDAVDSDTDPTPFLEHARGLFSSIPASNDDSLIEVDLSDRDQLARLLQASQQHSVSTQPSQPGVADLTSDEFRAELQRFTSFAEQLLESSEQPQVIDGLIDSLLKLQEMSASSQGEHVGRVVACALRVVESHRAARTGLPLDAVEFIIACRRIIPMILDSLDHPQRVSHAIDALVDQSAFVLMELRMGLQATDEFWPEPAPEDYQTIATGGLPDTEVDQPDPVAENGAHMIVSAPDPPAVPDPESEQQSPVSFPALETESLVHPEASIRVPVEQIDSLTRLIGELAVRSGGYSHRSRKVLSASQDINSIADRLRYLIRGWQQERYTAEQVAHHLNEITADLGLAANDLEHARNDHIAASERQADVRRRLEETVSQMRTMPVRLLTCPLRELVADHASQQGSEIELAVEGASNMIDAQYAEEIATALRELVVNAVEHGIEPPKLREQLGKPTTGTIRIKAFRDGSQIVIEVADDGAGIDEQHVLTTAQRLGYPVPSRGTTRDRVLQYIFLPGFTTKTASDGAQIGMGLDTVSAAVSTAAGSLAVRSDPGSGAVFTMRVPTASMLFPAQIVTVSSERYALPAAKIQPIERATITRIESLGDGYRAQIGDAQVPAADLGALLGVRSHHHIESDHGAFVLVDYDDDQWLLRVDHLLERQLIAFGPLAREHGHINGAVASTTLGTGAPAVVLDIAQVLDAGSRRSRRFSRQTGTLARVPFALVSDDSISVRRQLSTALEAEGWRVIEARDAFESRELLETVVPDLVVVDLDLPAHGGFQIMQAARKLGDMPVIGMTAHSDPDVRRRARTFNIDAFLKKPLDLDEFNDTLERVLHH
jgi:chemotaxis protein histidine kinase CheA